MVDSDRLLSTADAARLLGVTPKTVRRLVASGELQVARPGNPWRFDRAEVERFAASRLVEPGSFGDCYRLREVDGTTRVRRGSTAG